LKEKELLNHYNNICNDMLYARKVMGLPIEGELDDRDEWYFERCYEQIKEEARRELLKYQTWTKSKESGVPLRYQNCCFNNFECRNSEEEKRKAKVIQFIEKNDNDGVLLMTGSRGTGKSHLGVAIVRDMLGYYVCMEDVIYKIESSLNFKSAQTEEEVFANYTTKPILVLDEIGRTLKREKEIEFLSYILRKRYDNKLPTIIISNLDKKTLLKILGEAVVDRLTEVATSVEFSGESYRILKRAIA
jgi:DNA replication protein DnaC